MSPAVFLDRDGVIIVHKPYLADPAGVEPMPGAIRPLRALRDAGFKLVVISNQSVIGRGWATVAQVEATNARIAECYAAEGIEFDATYYCPHGTDEGCECRKPKPGLLLRAATDLNIDLTRSYMVGDNPTDIGAGRAANCARNFFLIGEHQLYQDAPRDEHLTGDDFEVVTTLDAVARAVLAD